MLGGRQAGKQDVIRATHIAASVGQVMAILFGLAGLMSGNWILLFIALFVYVGAQGEAQAVQMRSVFQNVLVREAMATQVQTVVATNSLQQATDMLLAGHQQDFPVVDRAQLVGILHRRDLLKALTSEDAGSTVSDIMCRECPFVGPLDQLDKATEMMQEADCSTIPVMDGGQMVGILTSENIGEWAMIQSALRERQSRAAVSA